MSGFLSPLIDSEDVSALPWASGKAVLVLSGAYLVLMSVISLIMRNKVSRCSPYLHSPRGMKISFSQRLWTRVVRSGREKKGRFTLGLVSLTFP